MRKKVLVNHKPKSKELSLLLRLLKAEEEININSSNELMLLNNINWCFFLELVDHHRCYPLVYSKLKNIDENLVPSHVIEALYHEYKKNTFKMLQLTGEMEHLSKVFDKKHIPLLFLKGPTVAYDLFGDISLRMSKDLDILVQEKDLEGTDKILLSLGYKKEEVQTILNEIKWRHHHIEYYHPEKKILVEIHWRLHPRSLKGASFKELWRRKRKSTLTDQPIYFMGKEDLLLYLISHGSRHGWFRLRWLKDIDRIVRIHNIDYKHFNSLVRKYRQKHLVGQAFQIANTLLDTPLHENIQNLAVTRRAISLANKALPYVNEMVQFHRGTMPRELAKSYRNYLLSIKTNRQRLMYFIILFYPNPLDEKTIKLPKRLYSLYFLLRPFLLFWRKFKKTHY
ncbi:nucleotidyltransferase family protein [Priestia megaterium]|uniref:nucleotidyltransferase domain-containing protein n=1 Tax=Priestia megaterium TaxID=1404 RepID=UPI00301E17A0